MADEIWRMPAQGLCGDVHGSSLYAGMTFDEIAKGTEGDEEEEIEDDYELLCDLYEECQTRRWPKGSPEAGFIKAFDKHHDGEGD